MKPRIFTFADLSPTDNNDYRIDFLDAIPGAEVAGVTLHGPGESRELERKDWEDVRSAEDDRRLRLVTPREPGDKDVTRGADDGDAPATRARATVRVVAAPGERKSSHLWQIIITAAFTVIGGTVPAVVGCYGQRANERLQAFDKLADKLSCSGEIVGPACLAHTLSVYRERKDQALSQLDAEQSKAYDCNTQMDSVMDETERLVGEGICAGRASPSECVLLARKYTVKLFTVCNQHKDAKAIEDCRLEQRKTIDTPLVLAASTPPAGGVPPTTIPPPLPRTTIVDGKVGAP
ncbi:MAG: hypothetical protein ABL886_09430 [Rhodoglobus sp.]